MTYLKLMANAAWAGAYAALMVAFLFLFLDAELGRRGIVSAAFAGLVASCLLIYVPVVAWLLPTLFMAIRFFAVRRLHAYWLSLKATHWLCITILSAATAVYYYNLRFSASLLSPTTLRMMRLSAGTMALSSAMALAFAVTAQFHHGHPARRQRIAGMALLLAPLALIPALMMMAGDPNDMPAAAAPGHVPSASPWMPRLLLVGIDAASMDQVLPLVSAQRLPAFDSLLQEGASARLDTVRPCATGVAWTALLTGTPPWTSGVGSSWEWVLPPGTARVQAMPQGIGMGLLERIGLVSRAPLSEGRRRTASLWEILADSGSEGIAIGWDEYHGAPKLEVPADELAAILGANPGAGVEGAGELYGFLYDAVARDRKHHEAALAALAASAARHSPVAVRLPGLGLVSRYYLRYHDPDAFGDVTPAEKEAFGRVLGGYYEFLDGLLGELVRASGEGTLVAVVSPHGVEPLGAPERLSRFLLRDASGIDPLASGWWRRGPDGVLFLRGPGVSQGTRLDDVDLVDVVPTVLFAMGLPIGRDMTGDLLRRVFTPAFLARRTVQFVPAYPRPASSEPGAELPAASR